MKMCKFYTGVFKTYKSWSSVEFQLKLVAFGFKECGHSKWLSNTLISLRFHMINHIEDRAGSY